MIEQKRSWIILMTPQGHIAGLGEDRDAAFAHALRMRQREAAWLGVNNEEERAALVEEDRQWAATLIEGEAHWTATFHFRDDEPEVTPDDRPIELLPVLLTRGTEIEICRCCGCTDAEPCEPPCFWADTDLCSACVVEDADPA